VDWLIEFQLKANDLTLFNYLFLKLRTAVHTAGDTHCLCTLRCNV